MRTVIGHMRVAASKVNNRNSKIANATQKQVAVPHIWRNSHGRASCAKYAEPVVPVSCGKHAQLQKAQLETLHRTRHRGTFSVDSRKVQLRTLLQTLACVIFFAGAKLPQLVSSFQSFCDLTFSFILRGATQFPTSIPNVRFYFFSN